MKLQILAAAAAVTLAAAPANAVITSVVLNAGPVTSSILTGLAIPANVQTLSGPTFFGFTERADILISGPDASRPLVDAAPSLLSPATRIPNNTTVSSHFFVFTPTENQGVSGTITFNQNIIGIQRGHGAMIHSASAQLRRGATTYALTAGQGLEAVDTLTFVNDKTLSFSLAATATNKDMFSVITAVPEPATWAMLLVGFGLVGFARRRQVRTVAA
jgi:hypothetical protein